MASSFEKSVKGGTKIKLAPPKSKYVEHILIATHAGEAGVAEIFRALQNRLRDSTWTIVFKSLIIVHLMIREGEPDVTLRFLATSPNRKLAINSFTEVQTQGRNIRTYAEYLYQRAVSFGQTKVDYVRGGEGRLKRLTVDKGLLRETESVQDQIRALLKCEFLSYEPENEITLTAFRLLTMDLLVLFHVMNEGTINALEHYFEMSHPDATRALNIYRTFVKQTDQVVQYLGVARHYEHATRLEIPKIKHAPTSLAASLEDYLNDKDFDVNRRQYLAQQEAKKNNKTLNGLNKSATESKSAASKPALTKNNPPPVKETPAPPPKDQPKGPAPDLIDFFESIEQNQQPMAQQQHVPQFQQQQLPQQGIPMQQGGFNAQGMVLQQQQPFNPSSGPSTNPFGPPQQPYPIQTNMTGMGISMTGNQASTFSPQNTSLSPISQGSVASFPAQPQHNFSTAPSESLQPQSTNPFRQSLMPNPTGLSSSPFTTSPPLTTNNRMSTNPFAKPNPSQQSPAMSSSPFNPSPPIQMSQSPPFSSPPQQFPQQPAQPLATGTNPFARNPSPSGLQQNQPQSSAPTGLAANPTGSTNPFRQSAFVNQQTGQGWQTGQQGTMGGLEQLPTIPVFPRPGQGT